MNDFLLKLRPKYPLSITPPTQTPVGVTIKTISGVSVVETSPNVHVQIKDETFLAIAVSDWITTGTTIFLRAFSWTKPVIEVTCHPNPVLAAGFIFELIPLRNPSQLYSVEFPPLEIHAQGVIIHTDLKEIFSKIQAFAIEFATSQSRAFLEQQRQVLLARARNRLQFASQIPVASTSRVSRNIITTRQLEIEAQERLRETIEAPQITIDHGDSHSTERSDNQTAQ